MVNHSVFGELMSNFNMEEAVDFRIKVLQMSTKEILEDVDDIIKDLDEIIEED